MANETFPIDLGKLQPLELDPAVSTLTDAQRAALKSNIQLCRDAIVFFTALAGAKGLSGQANQLKQAFTMLRAKAVKWRVKSVYWFSVDDFAGACNFCDHSGLFGSGFKPKKSWYAYVKLTGGTP